MFAYWGLFTWLPAFLESPVADGGAGMNLRTALWWIILTQLGAFAGYLSFGFIADAIGRRLAFILYLLAAAIVVPIYGQMGSNGTLLMILSPVLGFVGHGYFSLFGVMLAELFPTHVRATGQGFTYNAGRAVGALAPFVIGVLAKSHGIGPALALTSAFYVLGAILVMIVPRPKNEPAISPSV
jgi:sugar phosphate permease